VKKVLIIPLDWGMGHTARMIPLGECLKLSGYQVVFAISNKCKNLIEDYDFETITIRGYNVKYYLGISPVLSLFFQLPKFVITAISEILFIKRINKTKQFEMIISDNRPFANSSKIFSVYVTHQINIKGKGILNILASKIHKRLIKKFNCCLIPDTSDHRFSGHLSKPVLNNFKTVFLGPLSRFYYSHLSEQPQKKYDLTVIASGPEPFRTKFITDVLKVLNKLTGSFIIIGFTKKIETLKRNDNIEIKNHLPAAEFEKVLRQSDKIFSLSGYTTIMDMAILKKSLIILPTKGQWEQEYLAEYHKNSKGIYTIVNICEIGDYVKADLENCDTDFRGILENGVQQISKLCCQ